VDPVWNHAIYFSGKIGIIIVVFITCVRQDIMIISMSRDNAEYHEEIIK